MNMKNTQQGFIGLAIAVIVGLVLIGGGAYVYLNKGITKSDSSKIEDSTNSEVSTSPSPVTAKSISNKIYRHPSGLYNISLPSNWIVSDVREGVVFSDLGKKEPIGYTSNYTSLDHEVGIYLVDKDPAIEAKGMAEYSGRPYVEEKIKISGIDSKRIIYKETKAKSDSYVIPLNNNKFIVISVVARDGSDEWLSQGYKATQTMVIDQSKSTTAENQKDRAQDDLALRNLIATTRPSAEMYRDSHPNYAGFCNTTEEPTHRTLVEIKEKLGSQPFRCTDGDSYAVSAKLYSGEYYCADSTNFSGVISSLHTSNSCK
jgi:hypothetical protein